MLYLKIIWFFSDSTIINRIFEDFLSHEFVTADLENWRYGFHSFITEFHEPPGILYKAAPNPDPGIQKKRIPDL